MTGTEQVLANWDDIKRDEKQRTSVFDGIPRSMPSLAYAAKVGAKASKVGFDWPDVDGAFPKIVEETGELRTTIDAGDPAAQRDELGDLLFAVVNVARHLDVDPELALRAATDKFRTRFEGSSDWRRERGIDLRGRDLATLDAAVGRGQVDGRRLNRPARSGHRSRVTRPGAASSGPGAGCDASSSRVMSHSERQRRQRRSMTSSNTVVARHVERAKTNAGTP